MKAIDVMIKKTYIDNRLYRFLFLYVGRFELVRDKIGSIVTFSYLYQKCRELYWQNKNSIPMLEWMHGEDANFNGFNLLLLHVEISPVEINHFVLLISLLLLLRMKRWKDKFICILFYHNCKHFQEKRGDEKQVKNEQAQSYPTPLKKQEKLM